MRSARALIPTLKEAPSDATSVSHVRLLRERIVRDELEEAGALELLLPALLPAEYFQETNPKQNEMVGLDRAAAKVFELVQQALRVPAAGEAA